MAQQTINNGESGLVVRGKINDNFTEVYAGVATSQPLDADLTAIAALSTTAYGRALLTLANQAALQSAVGTINSRPNKVAGRWYNTVSTQLAAGAAVTANVIRLIPFYLSQAVTVSDLGARISTLAAAGNFQLAIYAMDSNSLPTGNALAVTGNISTASATTVSADITGADVSLTAGWYYAAVCADNGTVIFQTVANTFSHAGNLIGSTTIANVAPGNNLVLGFAQTFGTWPDLTGQTFTESASAVSAALLIKVASVP